MADSKECAELGCHTEILATCTICGGTLTATHHREYSMAVVMDRPVGFSHLGPSTEYAKNCIYPPEHQFGEATKEVPDVHSQHK